jgi:hypothetical protein
MPSLESHMKIERDIEDTVIDDSKRLLEIVDTLDGTFHSYVGAPGPSAQSLYEAIKEFEYKVDECIWGLDNLKREDATLPGLVLELRTQAEELKQIMKIVKPRNVVDGEEDAATVKHWISVKDTFTKTVNGIIDTFENNIPLGTINPN